MGQGIYLIAKAKLAQYLLDRAWQTNQYTDQPEKPWPWADLFPIARLYAPRLNINQVVLSDSSGRSLAFGPGHIGNSSYPGNPGTSIISGHRDSHFVFLRDLSYSDSLYVDNTANITRYTVYHTEILDTTDHHLQLDTSLDQLILITCYPFENWSPGGPLRYLVFASKAESVSDSF